MRFGDDHDPYRQSSNGSNTSATNNVTATKLGGVRCQARDPCFTPFSLGTLFCPNAAKQQGGDLSNRFWL